MSVSADDWVFYSDRPEWKDVVPIPQDDGPYSVVAIAYKDKFRDVYDYFRAILKLKEKSERALELTRDALYLNPGNYSVWQYRREIIKHLNKNLREELKYTEEMMKASEKNYQVWHHRRVLVEWAGDASEEDRVTAMFLATDPKNYHAWQHRQWYIRTFNLYHGELEFVESLIADDVRNNSAWNQRYFILNNTTQWTDDVIAHEVDYTLSKISLVVKNESSWNYLRGVMLNAEEGSPVFEKIRNFCEDLYASGGKSPYLLAYIVDMCDDALEKSNQPETLTPERAVQICEILATEVDKIRSQYWEYVKRNISAKAARTRAQVSTVNHAV